MVLLVHRRVEADENASFVFEAVLRLAEIALVHFDWMGIDVMITGDDVPRHVELFQDVPSGSERLFPSSAGNISQRENEEWFMLINLLNGTLKIGVIRSSLGIRYRDVRKERLAVLLAH